MTKHGHGLPRKRPGRPAKDEIDAALPELEPIDDLPELEALDALPELEAIEEDDGPVKAACVASDEDGFDTIVSFDVPEMPKKDVLGALGAPLDRIAASFGPDLRNNRVLVRFTGDGLIGSAIKTLLSEKLGAEKPLLVVCRRGYGDEQVHEGCMPTVEAECDVVSGVSTVRVETGDCELIDLPIAMAPHMVDLVAIARDSRIVFQFRGGAKPDEVMRDAMSMALRDAGARSLSVGARVLFDRDLEDGIQCSLSGNKASIVISLVDDDATTVDGLSLVLPSHAGSLDGKNVRFQFARESAGVQQFCVQFARDAGATLIEVGGPDDTDIVWPPLISVMPGKEVTLRLSSNGRSRAAVLAAFERECADHHDETHEQHVVVEWPKGFALDAEAARSLDVAVTSLAPSKLCCTFAGDDREPFYPAPLNFHLDGEMLTIGMDSESGKPRELQRAIDRHLPANTAAMQGKTVRIEITGEAAVSRTVKQGLFASVMDAGAMRLEIVEGGEHDVLLPPMLAVSQDEAGVSIATDVGGRDEEQQRRAIVRDLEGVELALQPVTVAGSSAAPSVVDYVLEQGASRVVMDGPEPLQIHPPLFGSVEKDRSSIRMTMEPTHDASMDMRMLEHEMPARIKDAGALKGVAATIAWPEGGSEDAAIAVLLEELRQGGVSEVHLEADGSGLVQLYPEPEVVSELSDDDAVQASSDGGLGDPSAESTPAQPAPEGALVTLLGRHDESSPPMVMVGVAPGDEESHVAAVEAELQAHVMRFRGRAVLLIPTSNGVDAPIRRSTALVKMLARVVPSGAAATLVFRGPDASGRPHFQVLHSAVASLQAGANFGDPRRTA